VPLLPSQLAPSTAIALSLSSTPQQPGTPCSSLQLAAPLTHPHSPCLASPFAAAALQQPGLPADAPQPAQPWQPASQPQQAQAAAVERGAAAGPSLPRSSPSAPPHRPVPLLVQQALDVLEVPLVGAAAA
jgi:hypothetical protein